MHSTVGDQHYFDSYREIASAVLSGAGYRLGPAGPPALHRPPGYVALLAVCAPQDPAHCYIRLQLLQGLLGGLAALLTVLAALAWGVDRRGALFAGWVVALWPFAVWETKVTVPENLLLALVPAALLWLTNARRSVRWVVLTGLAGAGMALTHPTYVATLPLFAATVATLAIDRGKKAFFAVVLIAAFCLPTGLWSWRNRGLGYDGIATGFGYNYFRGLYAFDVLLAGRPYFRDHDESAIAFVDGLLAQAGLRAFDSDLRRSDAPLNTFLDRRAIEHLEAHPIYSLAKVLVKMPLAWVQQQTAIRSGLTALLLAPLFALAMHGVRRRKSLRPVLWTILAINAAFAAVAVEAIPMRYMLPMMSPLAILAGAGLAAAPRTSGSVSGPVN